VTPLGRATLRDRIGRGELLGVILRMPDQHLVGVGQPRRMIPGTRPEQVSITDATRASKIGFA
jgi:hypothetical protein